MSLSFHSSKVINIFLYNDGIIRSSSFRQKTGLSVTNYGLEDRFDSICNDFGNDLILSVAKLNRSKV